MQLKPIGQIRSSIRNLSEAPRQGAEGAPDAWMEIEAEFERALETHPRNDPHAPLTGVFATRSPDRPNPLGLHPVTVKEISGTRLRIGPIEALDGTPVVDIKSGSS